MPVVTLDAPFGTADGIELRLVRVATDDLVPQRSPQLRLDVSAIRTARTDQMNQLWLAQIEQVGCPSVTNSRAKSGTADAG